jgi:hypothetical protein
MEPSGLSRNPPSRVEWKGKVIYVGDARQALTEHRITFEERDEFLGAIYAANPVLVSNPDAKSVYRMHIGDFLHYLQALKARWSNGLPLVSKEEALRRAHICNVCPQKSQVNGCYGCSGISKLLMHIPEKFMENNAGCGVCKCYLNNKVWMGEEVLSVDSRDLEYPSDCWMNEVSLQQLPVDDT